MKRITSDLVTSAPKPIIYHGLHKTITQDPLEPYLAKAAEKIKAALNNMTGQGRTAQRAFD
jgi:hypothetical protein